MNALSLDPQLLQLLGAKLNLNESEAAALQAGDYVRFFGQRLAADPGLASDPMFSMLMSTFGSPAAEEAEDEDEAAGDQVLEAEVVDPATDDDVGRRALVALRALAQILGACHCWGQDAGCPDCDGLGEPGYRHPRDPDTFLRWVQPTLRRMGLRLVRSGTTARPINRPKE